MDKHCPTFIYCPEDQMQRNPGLWYTIHSVLLCLYLCCLFLGCHRLWCSHLGPKGNGPIIKVCFCLLIVLQTVLISGSVADLVDAERRASRPSYGRNDRGVFFLTLAPDMLLNTTYFLLAFVWNRLAHPPPVSNAAHLSRDIIYTYLVVFMQGILLVLTVVYEDTYSNLGYIYASFYGGVALVITCLLFHHGGKIVNRLESGANLMKDQKMWELRNRFFVKVRRLTYVYVMMFIVIIPAAMFGFFQISNYVEWAYIFIVIRPGQALLVLAFFSVFSVFENEGTAGHGESEGGDSDFDFVDLNSKRAVYSSEMSGLQSGSTKGSDSNCAKVAMNMPAGAL